MQRCSQKAFAMCPTRNLCGAIEDATFTDDSECAAFNRSVDDKPMTNADRVRSMSDEELAKFINDSIACDHCIHDGHCNEFDNYQKCLEGVLNWLRLPVEDTECT